MSRRRGATRARPLTAAGVALVATLLAGILGGCGGDGDPEPGSEPLPAVAFPDEACDLILEQVARADLPDLDPTSQEVVNGEDESTATCGYAGGATTLAIVLTSYASPNDAALDGVLADGTDQACRTLEAGGATVNRTRFGCETDVTTSVDAARRIGTSTRVGREQADQAVARITLSLDTGATSTSDATSVATTQATLSAIEFRLGEVDPD